MRKVRVGMVVNNFDVGGLEKVVVSLLANLDREAFELFAICLDGEGRLFSEVSLPPASCLVVQKNPRIKLPLMRIDDNALLALRRFVREREIDILHAHNLAPLIYAGLGTKLLPGRPTLVYTEHNQIYRASRLERAKFLGYVRLADEVVTCSHDLEQFFRTRLHMRRPIRVLYNGIDGGRYALVANDAVKKELAIAPDEFVVGTGVVLSEQKGITFLIAAAKEVCAAEPKIRFVIAGDGPLRAKLEDEARATGLGERLRFLGFRRDIPDLVSAFDVYALSSLWEGLPLALLEALAIGKPIVATRVGGNPEIVEDGVNGLIVPPRDPHALAEAILKVYRSPELRAAAAHRNVEKFNRHFSLAAMVREHASLYHEIASRRGM